MTAAAAAAPAHHEPPPPTYLATKDSRSNTSADDLPPAKLEAGALSDEEYRRREKALVRKLDRNLIPFLTLLFILSFLDRVNIGTAKLAGLEDELGLSSLQYSIASMIFFVSYVAFEIPSNLVLKKFKPSRWIPLVVLLWSIIQICMGVVKNYGQLVALRFLLGLFECALFPGISLMLGAWYPRKELGLRIGLFFSGATLAGAFGGILGFAISKMAGIGGKQGWSWIFIIEGLLTFVAGCAAPWFVHDFPDDATFLTEDERAMVKERIRKDQGVPDNAPFAVARVKDALTDYKTWLFMLIYVGCAEPIYSQSLFSPTIIASLGTWTRPQSLLLSIPPYALGFVTTVCTAIIGDRYGHRGPLMFFWSSLATIAYIIFITVPITKPGVLYFAVFLSVASIAPCIATTIVWASSNFTNHYKKAMALGMVFSCGNSGGIWSALVYRTKDKPRYILGHGATLGFSAMCLIASVTVWFLMRRENARRDALYGPRPAPLAAGEKQSDEVLERHGLLGMTEAEIIAMGDKRPDFRYTL